jgi:hypothetical protein
MAVTMTATTVVWDATWCSLPEIYQHLRQPTGVANRVHKNNEIFLPKFYVHVTVQLESCLQTCMTYTIAECTVNKLLMMDRRTV